MLPPCVYGWLGDVNPECRIPRDNSAPGRRGGWHRAVDGVDIPLFKQIDFLPSEEHLGQASGYHAESPFMRCKSGMRMAQRKADLMN